MRGPHKSHCKICHQGASRVDEDFSNYLNDLLPAVITYHNPTNYDVLERTALSLFLGNLYYDSKKIRVCWCQVLLSSPHSATFTAL